MPRLSAESGGAGFGRSGLLRILFRMPLLHWKFQGSSSSPASRRASTSTLRLNKKDMDGRDKAGHDEERHRFLDLKQHAVGRSALDRHHQLGSP
jgi:hypothetical protein